MTDTRVIAIIIAATSPFGSGELKIEAEKTTVKPVLNGH